MPVIIETTSLTQVQASVDKAISEMSIFELATLHNQLRQNTHLFVINGDQIKSCHINEIKQWGDSIGIDITESDDNPEYPFNYWVNSIPSDISFSTERDALICAFEKFVVNK